MRRVAFAIDPEAKPGTIEVDIRKQRIGCACVSENASELLSQVRISGTCDVIHGPAITGKPHGSEVDVNHVEVKIKSGCCIKEVAVRGNITWMKEQGPQRDGRGYGDRVLRFHFEVCESADQTRTLVEAEATSHSKGGLIVWIRQRDRADLHGRRGRWNDPAVDRNSVGHFSISDSPVECFRKDAGAMCPRRQTAANNHAPSVTLLRRVAHLIRMRRVTLDRPSLG